MFDYYVLQVIQWQTDLLIPRKSCHCPTAEHGTSYSLHVSGLHGSAFDQAEGQTSQGASRFDFSFMSLQMLQTCTDIYKVKQGYPSGRRTWEWLQAEEHVTPIETLVWGEFFIKHPVTGRGKAAGVCCARYRLHNFHTHLCHGKPCTSTGYSPQKVNKLGQQNDQLHAPVPPPSLGSTYK